MSLSPHSSVNSPPMYHHSSFNSTPQSSTGSGYLAHPMSDQSFSEVLQNVRDMESGSESEELVMMPYQSDFLGTRSMTQPISPIGSHMPVHSGM